MLDIMKIIVRWYLVIGFVHTALMYALIELGYYAFKKGWVEFTGPNKELYSKIVNNYPNWTSKKSTIRNLIDVCKDILLWPRSLYKTVVDKQKVREHIKKNLPF